MRDHLTVSHFRVTRRRRMGSHSSTPEESVACVQTGRSKERVTQILVCSAHSQMQINNRPFVLCTAIKQHALLRALVWVAYRWKDAILHKERLLDAQPTSTFNLPESLRGYQLPIEQRQNVETTAGSVDQAPVDATVPLGSAVSLPFR